MSELLERLASHTTIDLVTTGRHSRESRTVEIWWFRVNGRFVITGTPGRRDWLANVRANPEVRIDTPIGDFDAIAREILDLSIRREVFADPRLAWYSSQAELDALIADAPMIEVDIQVGETGAGG